MTPREFKTLLQEKLSVFDKEAAGTVCEQLVKFLYQSREPFDKKIAESILQLLRNHRMFSLMQKVAQALIFTDRHSFRIYRQYAQSLIDSGHYSAALAVLNELSGIRINALPDSTDARKEGIEAEGLIGRLYKQLYVDTVKIGSFNSDFLKQALRAYYNVFVINPDEYLWHGINTVALLWRAEKDGVMLEGYPGYTELAKGILRTIEGKEEDKTIQNFDYATAAEACIALNKTAEAEKWTAYYAADRGCDAFGLGSALRQFEEVWLLEINTEPGKQVLPILHNELLKREGGNVLIDASEVRKLKEANIPFQKNFGNNVFIDFESYKTGYSCCESVARIGKSALKGEGTGFLLKGSALHESFNDEWLLMTNAHVISEDPHVRMAVGALHPAEALIVFEALDRNEKFRAGSVVFYSPPLQLDVTIISFKKEDLERLGRITKSITPYNIAPVIPHMNVNPALNPRLYVIGHPHGGPLQFSLQDNLLLDYEIPRIHYRTPTEGGSSGSPVFNEQWELVGIHHSGKKQMQRLNGNAGFYEANEGIWIQAVRDEIKKGIVLSEKN